MSVDKMEEQLDEILRPALQRPSEPVPDDFAERILCRIRKEQQRKMLARVVLEERLAIAGYIILSIAAIVVTAAFPGITAGLTKQVEIFADSVSRSTQAFGDNWQFYVGFACVFGWTVYFFVELLTSDIMAMQKRGGKGSR